MQLHPQRFENKKGNLGRPMVRLTLDILKQAYKEAADKEYQNCEGESILLRDQHPSVVVYLACQQPFVPHGCRHPNCLEHTNELAEKWFRKMFGLSDYEEIYFEYGWWKGRQMAAGEFPGHSDFLIDDTPVTNEWEEGEIRPSTMLKYHLAYLFGMHAGYFLHLRRLRMSN